MTSGRFKSFFFLLSVLILLVYHFSNIKSKREYSHSENRKLFFCIWNKFRRILSFNKGSGFSFS